MPDNQTLRISPRKDSYADWYLDVIKAGGLASYSDVPGCMIIEPNGTALWEMIRSLLDARIKATGHRNVIYPALIPQSLIDREASHIGGFAPELARIDRLHGEPLADPLCLRPTSETLIYADWAKKVRSITDLPILINQWGNVFRAERRTRPFLRTFEFHWQEGHTAHATAEEAMEETRRMLEEYRQLIEGKLAIPTIPGRKTDSERFAGAEATFTIEAMMQDGKALQSATSHYIGSGFPAAYGIRYQAGDNELRPIHATSWGLSTRIVGAIIMVHGDDAGLVLPPVVAPTQAVVLTIQDAKTVKAAGYDEAARSLVDRLASAGIRCEGDFSADRLGQKQFKWEKFGVPVRIVFGLSEMTGGTLTLIRRDTNARLTLPAETITDSLPHLLAEIQSDMHARAKSRLTENTVLVRDHDEVREIGDDSNRFFVGGWCGDTAKEAELKETLGLTIRCIPFEALSAEPRCLMTGRPAVQQVVVGKAY